MIVLRYADDIVVGFENEADARCFWDAMRARLVEFALTLHPEKTRLIEFGRFAAITRAQHGLGQTGELQFPGKWVSTTVRWLRQVVTGFFAYYAVPTNSAALSAFRYHVTYLWRRSLQRRSHKDSSTWQRVTRLADDWLPKPRILHPWPQQRFAVRYPRWEPYAGVPHVRICAGALGTGAPTAVGLRMAGVSSRA